MDSLPANVRQQICVYLQLEDLYAFVRTDRKLAMAARRSGYWPVPCLCLPHADEIRYHQNVHRIEDISIRTTGRSLESIRESQARYLTSLPASRVKVLDIGGWAFENLPVALVSFFMRCAPYLAIVGVSCGACRFRRCACVPFTLTQLVEGASRQICESLKPADSASAVLSYSVPCVMNLAPKAVGCVLDVRYVKGARGPAGELRHHLINSLWTTFLHIRTVSFANLTYLCCATQLRLEGHCSFPVLRTLICGATGAAALGAIGAAAFAVLEELEIWGNEPPCDYSDFTWHLPSLRTITLDYIHQHQVSRQRVGDRDPLPAYVVLSDAPHSGDLVSHLHSLATSVEVPEDMPWGMWFVARPVLVRSRSLREVYLRMPQGVPASFFVSQNTLASVCVSGYTQGKPENPRDTYYSGDTTLSVAAHRRLIPRPTETLSLGGACIALDADAGKRSLSTHPPTGVCPATLPRLASGQLVVRIITNDAYAPEASMSGREHMRIDRRSTGWEEGFHTKYLPW